MLSPCPACSLRHKTAKYELKKDPAPKTRIEEGIGTSLELSQKPKHILEFLYYDLVTDDLDTPINELGEPPSG